MATGNQLTFSLNGKYTSSEKVNERSNVIYAKHSTQTEYHPFFVNIYGVKFCLRNFISRLSSLEYA